MEKPEDSTAEHNPEYLGAKAPQRHEGDGRDRRREPVDASRPIEGEQNRRSEDEREVEHNANHGRGHRAKGAVEPTV